MTCWTRSYTLSLRSFFHSQGMAIYGIASAGSLSGSSIDDTLQFLNPDTARLSGSTVLGLEGNDLLYLGPNGYTAVASGTITQPALAETASGTLALTLVNSAGSTTTTTTYQFETGAATGITVDLTGVVTADRGVRTLYASQIYGNQGNDSIYLGAEISDVSASTVGGGAGNDVIGNYTFVDASAGSLTASAMSAGTFSNSFVEAGGGMTPSNLSSQEQPSQLLPSREVRATTISLSQLLSPLATVFNFLVVAVTTPSAAPSGMHSKAVLPLPVVVVQTPSS